MLITDRRRSRRALPELVAAAVAGGVDLVQLREPDLDATATRALAERLLAAIDGRAVLVVNRRREVATALGLGLHLPEAAAPGGGRCGLAADALLGRSVHSPAAARAAAGADYLLAGHVFPSASKPGRPPIGVEGLAAIVVAAPGPVLAVGGIDAGNARRAIAVGARGVAVIGAIAEADDPAAAAATLRAALDAAGEEVPMDAERADGTATAAAPGALGVVVNGEPAAVPAGWTVHDFLASKRLSDAMAIVERNGAIVDRADYASTALRAGDRLEVVHAVGGG